MVLSEPSNQKYLVALHSFPKFGPTRLKKLLAFFGSAEAAFNANILEYTQAGIDDFTASEFMAVRRRINPDALIEKIREEKIKIITLDSDIYPHILKEIPGFPILFFMKGSLLAQDKFSVAVVGARMITNYGKQAIMKIVPDLTRNQITIVSGLALGVDTYAHDIALENQGRTIAVLGSGLDQKSIYPPHNRDLAAKIAETGGAVISEFPLGTAPLKHHFPQRNRIIAGMSLATIVIEAKERSGSLITARFALEQGREVFAVPGNITSPSSIGPNLLIKQGAPPALSAGDIMEGLGLKNIPACVKMNNIAANSPEEAMIIEVLSNEPKYIDEIIAATKLSTTAVNSALTVMELKGMVKNLGGMEYARL